MGSRAFAGVVSLIACVVGTSAMFLAEARAAVPRPTSGGPAAMLDYVVKGHHGFPLPFTSNIRAGATTVIPPTSFDGPGSLNSTDLSAGSNSNCCALGPGSDGAATYGAAGITSWIQSSASYDYALMDASWIPNVWLEVAVARGCPHRRGTSTAVFGLTVRR